MGVPIARRARLAGALAIAAVSAALLPALTVPVAATPAGGTASDLRPRVVSKPIPFPELRLDQTATFSRRHAGSGTWRLADPAVIVQHVTGEDTMQAAWARFAANGRDLGEKPGPCAHFLIDTDGTIYQLVDPQVRCRHGIGLNHAAIAVEHVGRSTDAVLRNPAMMRSSTRLTVWLMAEYRIPVRDVVGDAESPASPFFRERYPEWRCLVADDFGRRAMRSYRASVRYVARSSDVPVGPSPDWVDPSC